MEFVVFQIIYLQNNFRLQVLWLSLLLTIADSLRISCQYGEVDSWAIYVENVYRCNVTAMNVEMADEVVEGITGTHLSAKRNDDVNVFSIRNKPCRFLPSGIGSLFRNLEGLEIYRAGLKAITKEDLKQFPNLKVLWIYANDLQTLPSGLLDNNQKLISVSFWNNNINSIAADVFDTLEDLQRVTLKENSCISRNAMNRNQIIELKLKIAKKCKPTTVPGRDLDLELLYLKKMMNSPKTENSHVVGDQSRLERRN